MKYKRPSLILVLFLAISINNIIYSQENTIDYSDQKKYEIANIEIIGLRHIQPAAVLKLINIKQGNMVVIPGPDISATIDKLWKQGLFEDIQIAYSNITENKISLVIKLKERARLSSIIIKGTKKAENDDLLEIISLKKGVQITENVLQKTKKQIKDYYKEKGFLNAESEIIITADSNSTYLSSVTINVTRNERVKIDDIVLNGVDKFKHQKIYFQMKETKRKRWYNIFKRSKYIPALFEEDKKQIIEKYKQKGYRDVNIISDTTEFLEDGNIKLTINIEEGPKYYFRNITWVGNSIYTETLLNQILGIQKGDTYNELLLEDKISGLEGISSLYLDNGYLFFNAEPVEINIENDSIDLEIRIYEGMQATINKIIIQGNTKTNDHVIYREITTKPGELFSRADIIRTQRELATLGYFNAETMGVEPVPNPENGTVDIIYTLEEQSTDQIELSGGFSGDYVVGSLKLSLTNFSTKNFFNKDAWAPIPSGDGQQLSLAVTYNPLYYQAYTATFVEPWLGGKKANSFSVSVYYSVRTNGEDRDDEDFGDWATFGTSVGLGRRLKRPDDFFTLNHALTYNKYTLDNYTISSLSSIPKYGSFNSINLSNTLTRNSIDQILYPRSGSKYSICLELTPPHSLFRSNAKNQEIIDYMDDIEYLLDLDDDELIEEMSERYVEEYGNADNPYDDFDDDDDAYEYAEGELKEYAEAHSLKWVEYFKVTLEAKQYTEIFDKFVIETRAQMGFLGHYNKNFLSPFELFDVGGDGVTSYNYYYGVETIPLRGYESDSGVTPDDGGYIYNKFSLEFRYPLTLETSATIYGLLFVEAGNAWSTFDEYSPFDLRRSAGVGIRVYLPMMGLLGFDFGYGFDDPEGENGSPSGWVPSFVLGQQF